MTHPEVPTPILLGVVGSRAYGLAGPDSDYDRAGIFMAPTDKILGLDGPGAVQESIVQHDPDRTLHEVGKFCGLALKGNPTVSELLWLPEYEIITPAGQLLVGLRKYFQGQKAIRAAYTGYAIQQARRLVQRSGEGRVGFDPDLAKRTAKHGRHCHRLLLQAEGLLRTGELVVDVSDHRDEIFASGELAERDPKGFYSLFEAKVADIDAIESSLPMEPQRDVVDAALVALRRDEGLRQSVSALTYLTVLYLEGVSSVDVGALVADVVGVTSRIKERESAS